MIAVEIKSQNQLTLRGFVTRSRVQSVSSSLDRGPTRAGFRSCLTRVRECFLRPRCVPAQLGFYAVHLRARKQINRTAPPEGGMCLQRGHLRLKACQVLGTLGTASPFTIQHSGCPKYLRVIRRLDSFSIGAAEITAGTTHPRHRGQSDP